MILQPKTQRGIALLEALISMLIFSLGILGVIAMQTTATKTVTETRYRTEAALLADEMMGRFWANIGNAASFNGFDTNVALPANCPTDETNTGLSCRWGKKVLVMLPAARGRIAVVNAGIAGSPGMQVTITLNWTVPGTTDVRNLDLTNVVVDR